MTSMNHNQASRDRWVTLLSREIASGSRVLDVGAGQGRYRQLFEHCVYRTHDFAAYDGSAEGLFAESWDYSTLDYVSDITELPVADGSFDVVLCTEVLEHVPRPIEALSELHRILVEGGRLIASAPLGSGLHQEPFHFYGGYTPHFWDRELRLLGFDDIVVDANGQLFAVLAQEIRRGAGVILNSGVYRRWHPVSIVARLAATDLVYNTLLEIDGRIPVREFTLGYHVTATKPATR